MTNAIPSISELQVSRGGSAPPRARPTRRLQAPYLAGPIPWGWIAAAARLPGRALAVALCVHHLTRLQRRPVVSFNAGNALLAEMGVSREAARRALRSLVQAGLVEVQPRAGRPALVRPLLDLPADTEGGAE